MAKLLSRCYLLMRIGELLNNLKNVFTFLKIVSKPLGDSSNFPARAGARRTYGRRLDGENNVQKMKIPKFSFSADSRRICFLDGNARQ